MVVVPGILGSRLAVDGHEVWGLSGAAIARGIMTLAGSVRRLAVPEDIGDEHPGDGVEPVGLVPDLHLLPMVGPAINGYSGLVGWLEREFTLTRAQHCGTGETPNLVAFAYDWRLSIRYNAAELQRRVVPVLDAWRAAGHADAQLVMICHSMGGLVARYFVECLGGADVTRRVVTLGTPHRGSLDALLRLVNDTRYGIRPLRLELTAFARSLPSLHQLAPDYACIEHNGGLARTDEVSLPGVDEKLLADGFALRRQIADSARQRGTSGHVTHPVVGVGQPTPATARIAANGLEPVDTIEGIDEGGDGRVPRFSARCDGMQDDDPAIQPHSEQHGSLQNNGAVRDALWYWLTSKRREYRASGNGVPLGLRIEEVLAAGQSCRIEVTAAPEYDALSLRAVMVPLGAGQASQRSLANRGGGRYETVFPPPRPCAYEVRIDDVSGRVLPVTAHVLVWGEV
ncbi:hypothetical protein KGA66_23480 [Actinocrinis puniceicyclus]|uniref:Lecithin:cholesterol acyltransferase n=1 Tax=Actinocrinis puniceicyclus TaxID=977794 RepID=A0A8J7WP93_9ACTN|nr:hypothetical protein [Actinocrinis puniceicyclus]MBS2966026.1 hypothetical protein [Actinocrinis puniceicyclus]